MKMLETAEAVRALFADRPKLLETWLMVGYRQWFKRTYMRKPKETKELEANKQLKSLSDSEWSALKKRVRSRLK